MSVVPMKLVTLTGPIGQFDPLAAASVLDREFHPEHALSILDRAGRLRPFVWSWGCCSAFWQAVLLWLARELPGL